MGILDTIAQAVANRLPSSKQSATGIEYGPAMGSADRVKGYATYQAIYDGEHKAALYDSSLSKAGLYICVNLPRLLATIPADLMLGEPFSVDFDEEGNEEAETAVNEIIRRSGLQSAGYEMAVSNAVKGDQILVSDRGEDGKARIKTIRPDIWFPECDPEDVRNVLVHRFAFVRDFVNGNKKSVYLRVIEHEKGLVKHRLFEVKGNKLEREVMPGEQPWRDLFPRGAPEPVQETGIDDFLVTHVANGRISGEYQGRSDYRDMPSLFQALNARVTQTNAILRRHAEPTLAVTNSMWSWLQARGQTEVDPETLKIVRQGENGEKSEYLTWDGKLTDSLAFIEELQNEILMLAEIDRQLVGKGDIGNLSGAALRTMLTRTLAKVNRKWKYTSEGLEHALIIAAQLEGVALESLSVKRSDGLPADVEQDTDVAIKRVEKGLSPAWRELMKLDDLTEDEAKERVKEATAEQDAAREKENESMTNAVIKQRDKQAFGKVAA